MLTNIFKEEWAKIFWLLALIIFLVKLSPALAETKPQFELGDKLSVFSDKAYRKNNGKYFEAVGNVVIISQKDTVYGELASLNQETMLVKVEGNVRFITKDMTLYGSHAEYNITSGVAVIKNARIITPDYNLVANELIRVNEKRYVAKEAEFSTCKDCTESWSVYGKNIQIDIGRYVTIHHGLAKIKGIDVLYLPYIVLPIQTKRKTGLLFPMISTRPNEGISFEQPVFVVVDDSKDLTLTPNFWAKRGYGGDIQYRHVGAEMSWLEVNTRLLNDTIYLPGETGHSLSGDEFFRYFTEVETHQQWSPNLTSHFRYTGARDLDIVRDHRLFTDPKVLSSDFGFKGFTDWRNNSLSIGVEADYLRNQLFSDPLKFDREYVQTMPRVGLSTVPMTLLQSDIPLLRHIAFGVEGSVTRFRQVDEVEPMYLRNADRLSTQPYLMWHLLSAGPISLKSRYTLDQQMYRFADPEQSNFGKNAGLMRTEISFTMDRIFGLAFEEKIPVKYLPESILNELAEKKEKGLSPIKKADVAVSRLVGQLPEFESELSQDNIVQIRNSYRHAQEFKLIHHYITSQNEYGNDKFRQQITTSNLGWFDSEDAKRSEEYLFGANRTRTIVPPENTAEIQWNNILIKKSPLNFSYLDDNKYLRDNFRYEKIGYFNVSQGYLFNNEDYFDDYRKRLTRLMIESGYSKGLWSVSAKEYYFHYENKNIFSLGFNRRFNYLNLLSSYNYNSFGQSNLNTLSIGGQVRPTDTLGFAMLKDLDIEANQNIRTIYSLDIMPHNNCWILSLNYGETLVDSRYSFNVMFNFGGDDNFEQFRTDYFRVKRL